MTPEEYAAVSRISPSLAPYIVLSVPMMGVVAYLLPGMRRWPIVRRLSLQWMGFDPGEVPQDETSRRTLQLVDQLQEELASIRPLLDRYTRDIDQLRQARLGLLAQLGELRDAAIAARTQVHGLERQFGVGETAFDPLPGALLELPMSQ